MKFIYCPRCKQLHVKPWFAIRNRCQSCLGEAAVIQIPPNWMTYASYVLYVLIPGLIAVYVTQHIQAFLYLAVALLVVMMIFSYVDIGRGEKYARDRIKVTSADADADTFKMRKRRG